MGSLAQEIGRDLKLFTKKIIGCFMKDEVPRGGASGLKELVCRLEEEQRKIDAFKRELPLCMILVNDAIDELKLEVEQFQNDGLVLEEFMTLKTRSYEDDEEEERRELKMEKESRDKMEWMSSAQLWNDNCSDGSDDCEKDSPERRQGEALSLESRSRYASVGAFLPFKVNPASSRKEEEKLMSLSLPDISLLVPEIKSDAGNNHLIGPVLKTAASAQVPPPPSSRDSSVRVDLQGPRKARRCWSPELHRRFISALHQLGGAQVATPKLIRELMSINGLTNDEVKSHLQKYRLHTRRMPNSSATRTNRPLDMDDALWNSQDHCADSQHSASESLQEPLRLTCTAQALSTTIGERCDDDKGKSESYCWK